MGKQVLIISLLFIVACTGSKRAGKKGSDFRELSAEETVKRIEANRLDFETLNSNATLQIKSEMFNGSVSAKIRMVHDSVIWISASKLGFEVGRMMVTPDSLFALERFQKTFIKESIEGLSTLAGIDLNFQQLQDILVGNAILHPTMNEVIYITQDSIQVYPENEEFKITHTISNGDFKLLQTTLVDERSKTSALMEFQDYQPLPGGQSFSYFRNIVVDQENGISIEFNNTELDTEKDIKFSIPPSYSPRQF